MPVLTPVLPARNKLIKEVGHGIIRRLVLNFVRSEKHTSLDYIENLPSF